MKVRDLGEFGLIEALSQIVDEAGVGIHSQPNLIIGIGDDAAVWQSEASVQLGTTDTLIEGVHFDLSMTSWFDLGWKSLAVNISDIAAMGGAPTLCMVSLGLPLDTELENVTELYKGMAEIAGKFSMAIAGGDISKSPMVTITPTIIGTAEKDEILSRSGAKPGDKIAVTGSLGSSSAGLKMLQNKTTVDTDTSVILRESHLRPWPRIVEAWILVQNGVKAAIDISDGLIADLGHICRASNVGAKVVLPSIPIHPATITVFPDDSMKMALTGGEDYELLFTAPDNVIESIQKHLTTPTTIIGVIVAENPGKVVLLDKRGNETELPQGGWEHFGKHV
ncbi:MAG: thiamine-phosphate kinase [Chloroflexi bacterium]|jgi:thiamine-monophosphate kinase|nr:thiamine-phosphate kinase [Chloroflexota bacterium]